MAIALSSPVTGGPQTGFTSPTYTVVADTAPTNKGKQWAVTALGGTQAGVTAHSIASPFTFMASLPAVFRVLGKPNPTTGLISNVPMNILKAITRKGMLPLAGQPYAVGMIRSEILLPAGADTADAANVRALFSMHIGSLWQLSAGFGDTGVSGLLG